MKNEEKFKSLKGCMACHVPQLPKLVKGVNPCHHFTKKKFNTQIQKVLDFGFDMSLTH